MIKLIAISVLSFTIPFLSFSQPSNFTTLNGGYYYYINKAELAVADLSFSTADSLYKIAFQKANRSFGQDFFLASINALRLNQHSDFIRYLKNAVKEGISKKQILNNPLVKKHVEGENIFEQIEYRKLRKIYLNSGNTLVSKKIRKMVRRDQLVRVIPGFFELFSYNLDRNNFRKIREMCIVFDSLPQYVSIKIDVNNKTDLDGIELLLRHFDLREINELTPYIMKSVNSGYFHPWFLATAIEYKVMTNPKVVNISQDSVSFCYRYKYGTFSPKYLGQEFSQGDCSVVDSIRGSIGLEPIKDQYGKRNKNIEDYFNFPSDTIVVIPKRELGKMWRTKWNK